MIRRYLAGIITGSGDVLGRRRAQPECWWGSAPDGMSWPTPHVR
jgi:hypothetical protein